MTNQLTSNPVVVDDAGADGDFTATVTFTNGPDAVYEALATTSGISGWWVPATGSAETGGELTFDFGGGLKLTGVDEATRPLFVRWTVLICEPAPDWVGTRIHFELNALDNGGTRLAFRHEGLTAQLECFESCHAGWTHYLGSLAAYVETGIGWPASSEK